MADGDTPVAGPTRGSGDRLDKDNRKEDEELKKQKDDFNKKEDELEKTGSAGIPDDNGTNSNPDGESGNFVFADLDELNGFIHKWIDQSQSIRMDGSTFQAAAGGIEPPVGDVLTTEYFGLLRQAFLEFTQHNHMMFEYSGEYVDKVYMGLLRSEWESARK